MDPKRISAVSYVTVAAFGLLLACAAIRAALS
jgi:hypothetical protein